MYQSKCPDAFKYHGQDDCSPKCVVELKKCKTGLSPTICDDFCEDKGVNPPTGGMGSSAKTKDCVRKNVNKGGFKCETGIEKCCGEDQNCKNAAQCCAYYTCKSNPDMCGSTCPPISGNHGGDAPSGGGSGGTKGYFPVDNKGPGCYANLQGECSLVCNKCDGCKTCEDSSCFNSADACLNTIKSKSIKGKSNKGKKGVSSSKASKLGDSSNNSKSFFSQEKGKYLIIFLVFLALVAIGVFVYIFYPKHRTGTKLISTSQSWKARNMS